MVLLGKILMGVAGSVAVGGWVVAAASWASLAASYPLPGRSFGWYAVHGTAAFDPSSFAPEGARLHTVMLGGMAAFGLGVLLAMVGGALSISE
jgi:hypothetical protein